MVLVVSCNRQTELDSNKRDGENVQGPECHLACPFLSVVRRRSVFASVTKSLDASLRGRYAHERGHLQAEALEGYSLLQGRIT